jgi:hypothetical protein
MLLPIHELGVIGEQKMAAGVSFQKKITIGMNARFTAGLEMEHGQGDGKRVAYCLS